MLQILSLLQHDLLPFIVVISVVVFVHEYGHYWIARRCGIKVEVFSIGFGHEIFGWNDRHGTRWKVSWLPLGGYVKMYGDGSAASTPDETVHSMTVAQRKVAFYHQSVNKRMAVVVAGPAANYVFAILVLALLFMFQGQTYIDPVAGDVIAGGAAASAGIQTGDRIVSVDGQSVQWFEDIVRIVSLNTGTQVPIVVERNHKQVQLSVTPRITSTKVFGEEVKVARIGIKSDPNKVEYKKLSPPAAIYEATRDTWNTSIDTLKGLGQMIIGLRATDEIGGPLRIAQISSNAAKDGLISLVHLMVFISINLGLINLFPVPLLDGGHLAFYLAEKLRGKPLRDSVQEVGLRVGMILVVTLMVFATWNDLVHLKVISYLRSLFS